MQSPIPSEAGNKERKLFLKREEALIACETPNQERT